MGLPCRSHRCAAPVPYPFSLVLFHVAVPLRSLFILRLIILSQFDYDVLNQTMGINGSKEVASPGSHSSNPARPHRSPTALRAASHSPREGKVTPRSTPPETLFQALFGRVWLLNVNWRARAFPFKERYN